MQKLSFLIQYLYSFLYKYTKTNIAKVLCKETECGTKYFEV